MNRMGEKPKFAFLGNSHMAFWALDVYFPSWECLNYGAPGEGLAYVESFTVDTSDCQVVIQFGTNDIYRLNDENMPAYVERYVKAVLAIPSLKTYLFCIFPRNDYDDYSTAVNQFIRVLNQKIYEKLQGTDIVYLDVFDRLLLDGRLNPELTLDDLHLNGKGYSILSEALKRASGL
ncbi:SGNH/GDSL hydrolase family protein [Bacteroides sp.]|uniref:SGNH/GDSL hydrolase family protein n=1 Tax=Bacteroides sp. TaxID=29523 RepID=UPI002A81EA93|nr:GDSL-type esterase/lipase family protein [Bacteroides sp.]